MGEERKDKQLPKYKHNKNNMNTKKKRQTTRNLNFNSEFLTIKGRVFFKRRICIKHIVLNKLKAEYS